MCTEIGYAGRGTTLAGTMFLVFIPAKMRLYFPRALLSLVEGGRGEKVLTEGSRGAVVNEKHSGGFI